MKLIILIFLTMITAGCSGLKPADADSSASTEDDSKPMDSCCAHWTGSSCVHEIIPGCSGSTSPADSSPFTSPSPSLITDPFNSSNCAHIGADGTCYHPM